ncbi:hypothetical protein EDB87DRAFT_385085 [Lactarius vividus]|nr:hypothetical protein EDB87DRAFT_385085 [Lactarius vividus]
MSKVQSTTTSSTDLKTTFRSALEAYKKLTKKDIASHSLVAQLQTCDSPSAILSVLRAQFQALDRPQTADGKFTKWLDPTVHVLYAFSATLGNSVGLVFPPSNAVFAGIGVLLQAIKGVRASQNALVDLFGRLEYFFKRLEAYIKVLSIVGIVTKEVRQGRTMRYLKELIGRKDVEEALQRLDKLTQEEARMAAAESLTITRGVDEKVTAVGERLERVDKRVLSVEMKVEGIDGKVQSVDSKVQSVNSKVQGIDRNIQGVDRKVGSVIQRVKETGVVTQQLVDRVGHLNWNELRKDLRKWIAPPDPSVNYNTASGAHHDGTAEWCTKGNILADWKTSGSLLWIHGKPGSGKSILSSVIIRDIKSMSNAGSVLLAYFYFDFKDKAKQDIRALLSSLLVQLSDQSDIFCEALFSLYRAHKQGSEQPTNESLSQCLKYMLTTAGPMPIYLILDALDECPYGIGLPSPREKLLDLVDDLVKLRLPTLRLCVTSRPEFDIRTMLKPLATQQVSLHDESGQTRDIKNYVTDVVHSDRRMKKWRDEEKDMVIEKLAEKADGM